MSTATGSRAARMIGDPRTPSAGAGASAVHRDDEIELLSTEDERIIIGEGVALDVRPAGFVLRAASTMIDMVVIYLAWLVALIGLSLLLAMLDRLHRMPDLAIIAAVYVVTLVSVTVAVPVAIETITKGRSLGRWIMGLRIVRDDGGAAGFRHALIRGLLGSFELVGTQGGVAALTGLLNARSKRLGDMLAGTYCQRERVAKLVPRAVEMPPRLIGWARTADVARLPDRTSRRILAYLEQYPKLDPAARRRLAESVGREAMPYVHPLPDVDADSFLRGVAVLRRERELRALALGDARRSRLAPILEGLPHGFPERG